MKELLQQIVKKHLRIEHFEPRNVDRLDFHDCYIGNIMDTVQAAFEAGKKSTNLVTSKSIDPVSVSVSVLYGLNIFGNPYIYTETDVEKDTLVSHGKCIGITSDDEWDIAVFSYQDEYYAMRTFNSSYVSKLVPLS